MYGTDINLRDGNISQNQQIISQYWEIHYIILNSKRTPKPNHVIELKVKWSI